MQKRETIDLNEFKSTEFPKTKQKFPKSIRVFLAQLKFKETKPTILNPLDWFTYNTNY